MQRAASRLEAAIRDVTLTDRLAAERLAAALGMLALAALAADWWRDEPFSGTPPLMQERLAERTPSAGPGAAGEDEAARRRDIMVGGYLGTSYTHQSTVTIKNPGRTDMTIGGFNWDGRPFKSPIYYGLRAWSWPAVSSLGTMLDFTHAKAIARFEDVATLTGTHEGKPLPGQAKVGEVFKHLEFSHGHNMVTMNGLMRLGRFRLQPYVGAGAGISLPHTEIAFRSEAGRTYEYQYAGLVGQGLVGVELRLGHASLFIEYKLSYAPYDVPLSGVVNGSWLPLDLWRQLRAWGSPPPGGRASTPLVSHHAIGGVMVNVAGRSAAAAPR